MSIFLGPRVEQNGEVESGPISISEETGGPRSTSPPFSPSRVELLKTKLKSDTSLKLTDMPSDHSTVR